MPNSNYVYFTTFPKISELTCILATINNYQEVSVSCHNFVILKCRQLIFEICDVIACPNLESPYGIYVILKDNYSESVIEYLKHHNLKFNPSVTFTKTIYSQCILYTITAKLAPKWNGVGDFLINGRNFLTDQTMKECIRFSVIIGEQGESTLNFGVYKAKFPKMVLEELDLLPDAKKEFELKKCVTLTDYKCNNIRVLPSLKRAKVLSIHANLEGLITPFKNYHKMKRHWKNTYGYRLPDTDCGIFYLEVQFFDGSPVFVYPSICVLPHEPMILQRINSVPVVGDFITDLVKMVPTVLGTGYPVPSYITRPSFTFTSASQQKQIPPEDQCNLAINAGEKCKIPEVQNSGFITLPYNSQLSNFKNKNFKNADSAENHRSNLSQLLSQLKKPENKPPIYLTQRSSYSQQISQQSIPTQAQNFETSTFGIKTPSVISTSSSVKQAQSRIKHGFENSNSLKFVTSEGFQQLTSFQTQQNGSESSIVRVETTSQNISNAAKTQIETKPGFGTSSTLKPATFQNSQQPAGVQKQTENFQTSVSKSVVRVSKNNPSSVQQAQTETSFSFKTPKLCNSVPFENVSDNFNIPTPKSTLSRYPTPKINIPPLKKPRKTTLGSAKLAKKETQKSSKISQDLQAQLQFLSSNIAQRASKIAAGSQNKSLASRSQSEFPKHPKRTGKLICQLSAGANKQKSSRTFNPPFKTTTPAQQLSELNEKMISCGK